MVISEETGTFKFEYLFILTYVTVGCFWRLQQERLHWLLIRIRTELSHVLYAVRDVASF